MNGNHPIMLLAGWVGGCVPVSDISILFAQRSVTTDGRVVVGARQGCSDRARSSRPDKGEQVHPRQLTQVAGAEPLPRDHGARALMHKKQSYEITITIIITGPSGQANKSGRDKVDMCAILMIWEQSVIELQKAVMDQSGRGITECNPLLVIDSRTRP